MEAETEALVVGGGQAGLAMARALTSQRIRCLVQERLPRAGDAWRQRFDSLTLFSSRRCSALPGLPVPGDPDGFPSKDEIADYLERYAAMLAVPVRTSDGVTSLSRQDRAFSALTESGRRIVARAVVVATGPYQRPRVPAFANELAKSIAQIDLGGYRCPADVPPGQVIVVGDGASGRQIALELARTHRVSLARGQRRHFVPQRLFGRDSMLRFAQLGLLTADKESWVGRVVRSQDAIPGLHLRDAALGRAGITLLPRVIGAAQEALALADGSRAQPGAVVWACGYRDDFRWIRVAGALAASRAVEERGLTPVPGLFHVGREWQTCRASALLYGVSRDAERIAAACRRHLDDTGDRARRTFVGPPTQVVCR
jgi:putative flavoprotein involved in K+ transport